MAKKEKVEKRVFSSYENVMNFIDLSHDFSDTPNRFFGDDEKAGDEVYSLKIVSQTRMMNSLRICSIIHEYAA